MKEARLRKDAADLEAKKCLDSAKEEANKIIKGAQMGVEAKIIEIASWDEEKKCIATTHNLEATIKLDIGGHSFTTTLTTLTRFPDTMLGAMFSGRHALTKNEAGAYFIDRDGRHFHYILNFLRSPESFDNSCIQGSTLMELKHEAGYYGLKDLMFFEPAKPELLEAAGKFFGNCVVTVSQGNDRLWYWKFNSIGGDKYVLDVCDNCGRGWPGYSADSQKATRFPQSFAPAIENFTTSRTISPEQPRVAGCCQCKKK